MKKKVLLAFMTVFIISLLGCQSTDTTATSIDIKPLVSTGAKNLVDAIETEYQEEYDSRNGSSSVSYSSEDYGVPKPVKTISSDDGSNLIIVNKLHAVTPDFVPTDLVAVDGSLSTNQGLYFKRDAYDAYLKMLKDANAQGINFLICSTYRSYSLQESIYFSHVNAYGAEYTNTVSAFPGRSEHHTGWAVDVTSPSMGYDLLESFINYPEGQWINAHCHEYGFIIRYPKDKTHITGYAYEPWHLRYVGVDVATEIMSKGLTLEEYLGVQY